MDSRRGCNAGKPCFVTCFTDIGRACERWLTPLRASISGDFDCRARPDRNSSAERHDCTERTMTRTDDMLCFDTTLLRPNKPDDDNWVFLVLPKTESEKLPRRGRTTVEGILNGIRFQATLDLDGRLSHWLKVNEDLREAAGAEIGDTVKLEMRPVEREPEPVMPPDLERALDSSSKARETWTATTTIARLDWIHWITSAKQPKTREKRIGDACDMLASGKKRVCCFDQSGFYSKALRAAEAAE